MTPLRQCPECNADSHIPKWVTCWNCGYKRVPEPALLSEGSVPCSEWICEAPPMTREAEGWWRVWMDKEWCVATIIYEPERPWRCATLRVHFLRRDGCSSCFTVERPDEVVWGGRLAVDGASQIDQAQRPLADSDAGRKGKHGTT